MTQRSDDTIIEQIKEMIEENVKPNVAQHGGNIEFVSYLDGHLQLELLGACSGCAGSLATLKNGVENMMKYFIPEITSVDATDGVSDVAPYYSSEPLSEPFDQSSDWDRTPMSKDEGNK
jgi:Fe-S cluster biogenesis protein NfuA|tara:strand:- start:183 stop:539 length:357 start_codon:yes stop_codon:yes gene_type:complete